MQIVQIWQFHVEYTIRSDPLKAVHILITYDTHTMPQPNSLVTKETDDQQSGDTQMVP